MAKFPRYVIEAGDWADERMGMGRLRTMQAARIGPAHSHLATFAREAKVCLKAPVRDKGRVNMSEYQAVGKVEDFDEGVGRAFAVNERMVAVFRRGDQFFAIDDICPHMGASLAEGHLEAETVSCPWHAWRFCIRDGTWEDNPRIKIDSFPVRVENGEVQVLVEPRQPKV